MAKMRNTEEWIKHLNYIHNDKYDYSKTNFSLGVMAKNIIMCPIHGEWLVTIDNHSNKKSGCPKCSGELNAKEKIELAKKLHNNKYSYENIDLNIPLLNSKKVKIKCNNCLNVFEQTWSNHYNMKQGCKKCRKARKSLDIETIKKRIKLLNIENIKYLWETYISYYVPMDMDCKEHGLFKQSIANHIQGQRCPNCYKSKGEIQIKKYLEKNKINYIQEKTFQGCIGDKTHLCFDFYLPEKNICIEYDGELHFRSVDFFGGEESFKQIQKYDNIKNQYCFNNNIKLIRIPYKEYKNIDKILDNEI